MSSTICPVCRTEFAGWVKRCSNCGVAVAAAGERIDVLSLPEDAQLVYELDGWTLDQRAELGEMLAEADVPHAWDGTDLIVAEVDEGVVDEMCADIEGDDGEVDPADAPLAADDDADGEDNDPDREGEVSYELDEWEQADRDRLATELRVASVVFQWEGTTLVVDAVHEDAVDTAIDAIVPPEDPLPEAPFEVLGDLFVAADRLRHSADDEQGLQMLTSVIDTIDECSAPYGVEVLVWERIVVAADALADALSDGGDDETVEARADELRALLRPLV